MLSVAFLLSLDDWYNLNLCLFVCVSNYIYVIKIHDYRLTFCLYIFYFHKIPIWCLLFLFVSIYLHIFISTLNVIWEIQIIFYFIFDWHWYDENIHINSLLSFQFQFKHLLNYIYNFSVTELFDVKWQTFVC